MNKKQLKIKVLKQKLEEATGKKVILKEFDDEEDENKGAIVDLSEFKEETKPLVEKMSTLCSELYKYYKQYKQKSYSTNNKQLKIYTDRLGSDLNALNFAIDRLTP